MDLRRAAWGQGGGRAGALCWTGRRMTRLVKLLRRAGHRPVVNAKPLWRPAAKVDPLRGPTQQQGSRTGGLQQGSRTGGLQQDSRTGGRRQEAAAAQAQRIAAAQELRTPAAQTQWISATQEPRAAAAQEKQVSAWPPTGNQKVHASYWQGQPSGGQKQMLAMLPTENQGQVSAGRPLKTQEQVLAGPPQRNQAGLVVALWSWAAESLIHCAAEVADDVGTKHKNSGSHSFASMIQK